MTIEFLGKGWATRRKTPLRAQWEPKSRVLQKRHLLRHHSRKSFRRSLKQLSMPDVVPWKVSSQNRIRNRSRGKRRAALSAFEQLMRVAGTHRATPDVVPWKVSSQNRIRNRSRGKRRAALSAFEQLMRGRS